MILRHGALAILFISLLWSTAAAVDWSDKRTPEQRYWEKVHAAEKRKKDKQEKQLLHAREETKAYVPYLVKVGAAIQPELIKAAGLLEPPPQPSFFDLYKNHLGLFAALLMAVGLVFRVLVRHRREAELRKLCGGYLSDGTEVANYKLPEWFAPETKGSTDPEPTPETESNEPGTEGTPPPDPSVRFFEQAPEQLAKIRELLKELSNPLEPEARFKPLQDLHGLVSALLAQAKGWTLRPVWQMTSALELLVKRVADKPKDATPSVLRTIASAVDTLAEVCVPGIRPNLLTDPPVRILAVDDDPLCRRALQLAFEKANVTPDLAENGKKAVELATAHTYDVVFMDIQMPGLDGMTACMQIRDTKKNCNVPVIFVTVKSDFNTRAQSRLKGGTDLMAKPFLVFELTVRAVTFAMRKRLQLSGNTRHEVTSVAIASASQSASSQTPVKTVADPTDSKTPGGAVAPIIVPRLSGDFFREVPAYLAATRKIVEDLRTASDKPDLSAPMGDIYLRVHAVANKAGMANLPVTAKVSSMLEALLKRLYRNPNTITASTLNTVSRAVKLLQNLAVPGVEAKLAEFSAVQILVVDDEPLARRAIVGALQLAFEKPESANDGFEASALAAQKTYDVIFTDVHMPTVNGYELCNDLRSSQSNPNTPVVFITSDLDTEAEAKAIASGADDFIGKPFLPIEITVKALTFAWEGRMKKITAAAAPAQSQSPPREEMRTASLAA